MWEIPVHMARNAEGLHQEALAGRKPWNGKSPKLLIPAQDGHLAQALEAS